MESKKFEVAGNVSIVSTGKAKVHKEEFEKIVDSATKPAATEGTTLTDMYDRFSKLLYVVDASGSMGEGMMTDEAVNNYKWTPEIIAEFREKMKADKDFEDELDEDEEEEDEEFDDEDTEDDEEDEEDVELDIDALSDDQVKRMVVTMGLMARYNIYVPMNYSQRSRGRSKMMALKDAAKGFVNKRFQKFPDARVEVWQFEDHPQLLVASGASEQEVINGIGRLPDMGGGGTNIFRAVDRVVNECKRRPSEVGLHHIVLVSDGCDYGAVKVEDLVPKMKELGIVFDFIYMLGLSPDMQGEEVAAVMRRVCEATGGEYTVVRTEEDFIQKFLTASSRPMLPASVK